MWHFLLASSPLIGAGTGAKIPLWVAVPNLLMWSGDWLNRFEVSDATKMGVSGGTFG